MRTADGLKRLSEEPMGCARLATPVKHPDSCLRSSIGALLEKQHGGCMTAKSNLSA